jgi:hypothetical protein
MITRGWDQLDGLLERRRLGIQNASSTLTYPNNIGTEIFYSADRKRPYFNNCRHQRIYALNNAYTATYCRGDKCWNAPYMRTLDSRDINDVNSLDQHFIADASNAQRTAWGTMQPRFEGNVNLFVFIAELKDFREIAKFLAKKPLRKLSNYFRKLKGRWKAKGLKKYDFTRPLAELHLTNEFALKPLLSDIYKITCQMETLVSEAQAKFADAGRELSSRHYSEELFREDADERTAYQQAKYPEKLVGRSKVLTFTATMEYSYEYNMRSTLDAFMKYWGLVPNAEAIWELIPFSFLIDYFYKIGNSIRVASRDSNVRLDLNQYCESLTSYETVGTHYKDEYLLGPLVIGDPMGNNPIGRAPNNLISGVASSLYTRRVCHPNKGLALPRFAKPRSKQQLNMLALARCFL